MAGLKIAARARRRADARVPAPDAAGRGQPVRHDLPRALLVLLVRDRRRGSSRAHGLDVFDVEEICRRTAGRCASTRRHAEDEPRTRRPRRRDCSRASRPPASRRSSRTRASPSASRETKRELLEFLIAAAARGQARRRLRRAGQGQHAAQLLRDPHRPPRLHRRPQPVQAGPLPAGHAHPDPPTRSRLAETRPDYILDPSLEPRGRDRRAARVHARVGRAIRRPASPGRRSVLSVKVVLFCGGLGCACASTPSASRSRWSPIGYRPILWHVMKYYAHFGHKDFILCLGHKAEAIKELLPQLRRGALERLRAPRGRQQTSSSCASDIDDWRITFVDTGPARATSASGCRRCSRTSRARRCSSPTTPTGSPTCRCRSSSRLRAQRTRRQRSCACGRATRSTSSRVDDDGVVAGIAGRRRSPTSGSTAASSSSARRSSTTSTRARSSSTSRSERLIAAGSCSRTSTTGFWAPMDTLKDKQKLEAMLESGNAPWRVWEDGSARTGGSSSAR